MASRFASTSTLHQRDPRSALFDSYTGDRRSRDASSPAPRPSSGASSSSPYASYYAAPSHSSPPYQHQQQQQFGGGGSQASGRSSSSGGGGGGFRGATPNAKGQYSTATLDSLERQNDDQISLMSGKVSQLKNMTIAIGEEIKASSSLAETMNEGFENTRVRLRGTMGRMLRMAERTGVGWRVWVGFFLFVWCVFVYVWLF